MSDPTGLVQRLGSYCNGIRGVLSPARASRLHATIEA